MIKFEKNFFNKYIFILILFTLFLGYYVDNRYYFNNVKGISIIFLIVLTIIYIFNNYKKFNKKELFLVGKISFSLILLPKYYLSFFLIIISKGISKRKRVVYFLIISIFFFLLTIVLNYFGLLQNKNNEIEYFRKIGQELITRKDFGFGHPNSAMVALLPILFSIYYLYYRTNKVRTLMLIIFLGQLMYKYTSSRTGYYLIILLIMISFIKDKYIKKLKNLIYLGVFCLLYFSFILPAKLKGTIYDKIFSTRFTLFDYYLKNQEITLFGNNEIQKLYKIIPLDNTYIRILFEQGIVGLIFLIFIILYIINVLFKNKDFEVIRIFVIILIFGITEGAAFYYFFNILYLLIYEYLIKDK